MNNRNVNNLEMHFVYEFSMLSCHTADLQTVQAKPTVHLSGQSFSNKS